MAGRHKEIVDCIKDTLSAELGNAYLYDEIQVEDYQENNPLQQGISIIPHSDSEQLGTNERDDIDYGTLVVRSTHALGNDDLDSKSAFRDDLRRIFHNKRIQCGEDCYLYSRVAFGSFSVPRPWEAGNKSVTVVRILTLIRETRG